MILLPIEHITYKTSLKESEVIKRIEDNIEPEKFIRFNMYNNDATKPYEGQINGQTFSIKRMINYRNSFAPIINGTVNNGFDGITIKVTMRLTVFAIVFLFIWFSVVVSSYFPNPIVTNSSGKSEPMRHLFSFGMSLFFYVLTLVSFKYESYKSKKDLQKIFEAEII